MLNRMSSIAGIGDLDDFGSLSTVPMTVKLSSSKKQADKPRITVMYELVNDFSTVSYTHLPSPRD